MCKVIYIYFIFVINIRHTFICICFYKSLFFMSIAILIYTLIALREFTGVHSTELLGSPCNGTKFRNNENQSIIRMCVSAP